jgi:hypothetical protein
MFKSIYYYSAGIMHKIIDDDFTQYVNAQAPNSNYPNSIINVYEERDLLVALNLVLFFIWYNKDCGDMNNQIELCKKLVPDFAKYEEDIQKYLILI